MVLWDHPKLPVPSTTTSRIEGTVCRKPPLITPLNPARTAVPEACPGSPWRGEGRLCRPSNLKGFLAWPSRL
jgi:hypothetical protein